MGFLELLTIIFIVLKLLGIISWGWCLVLLPEIISIALYVIMIAFYIWACVNIDKKGR